MSEFQPIERDTDSSDGSATPFYIGQDVHVTASILHTTDGWDGARHLPTFALPGQILGTASWDGSATLALDILFPFGPTPGVTRVCLALSALSGTAVRSFNVN